jgi:hypothetical protein
VRTAYRLLVLVLTLATVPVACRYPPAKPAADPNRPKPPEVAPIEDAPVLRPMPTPPGRESEVPGPPPAISP